MHLMRCKHCRYRLDGLADNRCPECGEAFDPNDPTTFEKRFAPRSHAIRDWCLVAGAAAALAVGAVFLFGIDFVFSIVAFCALLAVCPFLENALDRFRGRAYDRLNQRR